ncbi:hypothetical protein BBP40_003109 [Aspergillus hancockii]|nr:hypothetical protein BBP40_003109 [Aspergillus hancockii]
MVRGEHFDQLGEQRKAFVVAFGEILNNVYWSGFDIESPPAGEQYCSYSDDPDATPPRGPVRFTDYPLEQNYPSRVDEKTKENDEDLTEVDTGSGEKDAEWDMERLPKHHANQTNDYRLNEKEQLGGIFMPLAIMKDLERRVLTLESGMGEQRTWNGESTKVVSSALATDSRTEPKSVRGNGRAKRPIAW